MRRIGPVSHRLRRRVESELRDVPPDRMVLVACSGGPDSLALAAVSANLDRSVGAVVVNHGLQQDSAAVAQAAAASCRTLGLDPVIVVPARPTAASGGPEAAARRARYAALEQAADEHDAAAVLLAHTLDDQAETVLLGLARGSGVRSLAGMPAQRGRFRRPLLGHRRSELAAALAEFGLTPWLDPHNDDPHYLRVRVRQTALPVLEEVLGPGVAEALARTAALARDDADALDLAATAQRARIAAAGWPVAELAALPRAMMTRVLRAELLATGAAAEDLGYEHVQAVDRLVTEFHGQGPLRLPGGVTVTRRYGRLTIAGAGG